MFSTSRVDFRYLIDVAEETTLLFGFDVGSADFRKAAKLLDAGDTIVASIPQSAPFWGGARASAAVTPGRYTLEGSLIFAPLVPESTDPNDVRGALFTGFAVGTELSFIPAPTAFAAGLLLAAASLGRRRA